MPVFFTFLNTTFWWGACNQAAAPGITNLSAWPWYRSGSFGKDLSFHGLTNFMLKWVWCGSEGDYDDFCLWDS